MRFWAQFPCRKRRYDSICFCDLDVLPESVCILSTVHNRSDACIFVTELCNFCSLLPLEASEEENQEAAVWPEDAKEIIRFLSHMAAMVKKMAKEIFN